MTREDKVEFLNKNLKVGDEFVVVDDYPADGGGFIPEMECTFGKVFHISYIYGKDNNKAVQSKKWAYLINSDINIDKTYDLYLKNNQKSPKSMLRSGFKVVTRWKGEYYVLLEVEHCIKKGVNGVLRLEFYDDNLLRNEDFSTTINSYDIMQIYDGEKLVWERIEKDEKQLEIERIESEMRKLANDLAKLKD